VRPFAVERRAFGDPPVCRDAIAIYAQVCAGRHGDETVVFKFAKPALHRSLRFRAEIVGGLSIGSENLPVVQEVVPQIAAQNDVQRPRAV